MIRLPDMSGTTYAVMGLGASGLAAAGALAASGARVLAWDDDAGCRSDAEARGIPLTDVSETGISGAEALVLSPGIPHTFPAPHPIALQAETAGVPIICDVELLARAKPKSNFIGITGTNGKSTVTALIGHIFRVAGREAAIGGNLGPAALGLDDLSDGGTYILELSSYQLERLNTAAFDIAVLVNISPDHLDRHGGMEGYVAAKERLFGLTRGAAVAVVAVDDEHCHAIERRLRDRTDLRIIPVSGNAPVAGGVWVEDGRVMDSTGESARPIADLSAAPALPGRHNRQNAAAAAAAALAAGLTAEDIAEGLATYPGLPHRMEPVRSLGTVTFINDSKATNLEAALNAIACYSDIYWIAGGRSKEGGFDGFAQAADDMAKHIRQAFLIGEAAREIAAVLGDTIPHTLCETLETAVAAANDAARKSAARGSRDAEVLLSPACASFDQFRNFEHRGEAFRAAVKALHEVPA